MRVTRTVGACAVVLALCGIGASAASAAEYPLTALPELGRCVKLPSASGKFVFGNCIGKDKDHEDGAYEWMPGPSEHGTIKLTLNSVVLETVGFNRIVCTVGFLTGEYLNGKEVKVAKTKLEGCLDVRPNTGCSSSVVEKNSVIESTTPFVGTIGFLPNPKNELNPYVGVDLKPELEGFPLLKFECGEFPTGVSVEIGGSVIGKITKLNRMLTANSAIYRQKEGHQQYTAFKTFPTDTLTETVAPLSNPLSKTTEAAALGGAGELVNGEAIEFKAKQH